MNVVQDRSRGILLSLRRHAKSAVVNDEIVLAIRFQDAIARRACGCRVHAQHTKTVAGMPIVYRRHWGYFTAKKKYLPTVSEKSCERKTKRPSRSLLEGRFQREPKILGGANGCLNFRLIDIEVRVDMLHVVVVFQRFHHSQHLLRL